MRTGAVLQAACLRCNSEVGPPWQLWKPERAYQPHSCHKYQDVSKPVLLQVEEIVSPRDGLPRVYMGRTAGLCQNCPGAAQACLCSKDTADGCQSACVGVST
jgi:hypothetical protein